MSQPSHPAHAVDSRVGCASAGVRTGCAWRWRASRSSTSRRSTWRCRRSRRRSARRPPSCSSSSSGYVLTFGLTLVPAGRIGDQRSRRDALRHRPQPLHAHEPRLRARADRRGAARRSAPAGRRGRHPDAAGARVSSSSCSRAPSAARRSGCSGPPSASRRRSGRRSAASRSRSAALRTAGAGIFWMNVPLSLAAIALALWLLPETRPSVLAQARARPDRPAAVRHHRRRAHVAVPLHHGIARRQPRPVVAARRVRVRGDARSSRGSGATRRPAGTRSCRSRCSA